MERAITGDSMGSMVVVVSQEGKYLAVPPDMVLQLLETGYRLATPTELNQFVQEQKRKSDLRE